MRQDCCDGGSLRLLCKLCPKSPTYYGAGPVNSGVAAGIEARDTGMARVEAGAPWHFKAEADRAVWVIARRQKEFTTDEVWAEITPAAIIGIEPRAIGPVLFAAARRGWIVNTRRQRLTSRAIAHARPVTIWESKIMGEAGSR